MQPLKQLLMQLKQSLIGGQQLGNLAELQTRIADLETRCTDIERMREDMDDLRYAFAKAVTARPARVVNKPK